MPHRPNHYRPRIPTARWLKKTPAQRRLYATPNEYNANYSSDATGPGRPIPGSQNFNPGTKAREKRAKTHSNRKK